MKIERPDLLREFRGPGRCELCDAMCSIREAAHIFSKGAGQLDVRINLLALGSTTNFKCDCHSRSHYGDGATRQQMLQIVARREMCDPDDIQAVIYLLRRLPKEWSDATVLYEARDQRKSMQELVRKTLREACR